MESLLAHLAPAPLESGRWFAVAPPRHPLRPERLSTFSARRFSTASVAGSRGFDTHHFPVAASLGLSEALKLDAPSLRVIITSKTVKKREKYFSVLGVPVTATQEVIRDRFRFLSHAFHPDKFTTPEHRRSAEDEFKLINEAHRALARPGNVESEKEPALAPYPFVRDHYSVLRIHHKAASSQIERRYRFLCAAYDPAKFASADHKAIAETELGLLERAIQVLLDSEHRTLFDASRRREDFRPLLKPQYVASGPWRRNYDPRRSSRSHSPELVAIVLVIALAFLMGACDQLARLTHK